MYTQIVKTNYKAVTPAREHETDVGYDLTAIELCKKLGSKTWLFDTCIKVKPPDGYYIEIVPRSSISKTGYILANSVGTIDPDYKGTLKIALTKVDDDVEMLELPFCLCQFVLRKALYCEIIVVSEIDGDDRGGGFGSTDVAKEARKLLNRDFKAIWNSITFDTVPFMDDYTDEMCTLLLDNIDRKSLFDSKILKKVEDMLCGSLGQEDVRESCTFGVSYHDTYQKNIHNTLVNFFNYASCEEKGCRELLAAGCICLKHGMVS
jgi:deoxyuridine 5'-triphosphate nucleotidohydrolase